MYNLEEQFNAKIKFRTLSTWYYSFSDRALRTYGVFMCIYEDKLYLEDFNRVPSILGYPVKSKTTVKYEKYSRTIALSDIENIYLVKKRTAEAIINDPNYRVLQPISTFDKIFSRYVTQIKLKGNDSIFVELIDPEAFRKAIEKNK